MDVKRVLLWVIVGVVVWWAWQNFGKAAIAGANGNGE